ncbi:phospholipase A2 family protein [Corynebacterium sp.]|uniref:phospholipase A2 family protein n=1 Tax=Corynebacterium sp. TaxID=1720 RepID=UPI0026DC9924|nr:phospholipase A2 family protein [Corynebacterium sp.]MDO5077293.1 hypothetical protein [Corynebacterium sp.]
MKIKKLLTASMVGISLTAFPAITAMPAESLPSASTTSTTPSLHSDNGPTEEEIKEVIFSHQIKRDGGIELFDAESAERDNVDPRIVEVGKIYNNIILEEKALTDPGLVEEVVPFENYGNWCGPTNSGPGDPINSLDRACMGHDHCLNVNRDTCTCDQEFVNNLRYLRGEYPWGVSFEGDHARGYLEAAIIGVPLYHGCGNL